MAEPLIIIGAGGFGREAHDVVVAINRAASEPVWDFLGFLDDSEVQMDRLERRGTVLLGTTGRLPEYCRRLVRRGYRKRGGTKSVGCPR